MSGANLWSRQEWLEVAFEYVSMFPDGVEGTQLGIVVPRNRCREKLPTISRLPNIDRRFRFHNNRLYAVPPEDEMPVPTGAIGDVDSTADQFYAFLGRQNTSSAMLIDELERYFNRWRAESHQRATFTRVLQSLVRRNFLRFVKRSGRYVPRFRDPLFRRATSSSRSTRGGIFVGEIKFEPVETIPGVRLHTRLLIRNDSVSDVVLEQVEWFQRSPLFFITDDLPLTVPVGSSVELDVQYRPARVGVHYNCCVLHISGLRFMRGCQASSASPLAAHLRPTEPYSRRERRRRGPRGEVVATGDRRPSRCLPFKVQLSDYPIPSGVSNTIAGGELEARLRTVSASLWDGMAELNSTRYAELFSKLLFAEEVAVLEEIESYGLENVGFAREERLYIIEVPGLSENRPSVVVGDSVEVCRSTDQRSVHKGFVHDVRQSTIAVRFHNSFDQLWSPSALFDVDFKFKRTLYNIMHDTLRRICSGRYDSILLPRSGANEMGALVRHLERLRLEDLPVRNGNLNEEQRLAVRKILDRESQPQAPFVLFGPPGTGKTSTLVEAILQLMQRPYATLLVVAPSNAAADEIVRRLAVFDVNPRDLLRVNAYSRYVRDLDPLVLRYSTADEDGHFSMPGMGDLQRYRVVVATCSTSAKLFYQGMPEAHFTHVIIDECGHCMEPEAISSFINLASEHTRLVMAGDPEQLGPVVQSSVASQAGLAMSLLERYTSKVPLYRHHDDGQFADTLGYNPSYIVKLVRCYRCHPEIIRIPNRRFYLNQLIPSARPDVINGLLQWHRLPNAAFPLIFHSCNGENLQEGNSPSWFNIQEIETVMEYVRELRDFGVGADEIGIITPYRRQVKKMRLALALTGLRDVSVGSCEQFQGQERKVIIISTVRSSPDLLQQDARFNLGFVGNRKRFNVAVTRAQALLIVVGNPRVLCGDENWRELYEHCRENGACTGDAAWTSPEDVEDRAEEIFGGDDDVWADVESDNEDNAGPGDGDADDGAPPASARPRQTNTNCVVS